MYRTCIFCSAKLGSNDSIERFPVGRTLAFDAAKGRLWAVCPKCSRWNLSPIEERWEAIDDAEKLFRDTRVRAQAENIGIARLRDGTRLVRIGAALTGEVAAWRYGRHMRRLWMRHVWGGKVRPLATLAAWMAASAVVVPLAILPGAVAVYRGLGAFRRANLIAYRVSAADSPTGSPIHLRWRDFSLMRLGLAESGPVVHLHQSREMEVTETPVVLGEPSASAIMGRALTRINGSGASSTELDHALHRLADAGGRDTLLRQAGRANPGLEVPDMPYWRPPAPALTGVAPDGYDWVVDGHVYPATPLSRDRPTALALEMALHEETERRAMEGELAALEAMWREAEGIAEIADRLPDDVPASDPPRLKG